MDMRRLGLEAELARIIRALRRAREYSDDLKMDTLSEDLLQMELEMQRVHVDVVSERKPRGREPQRRLT